MIEHTGVATGSSYKNFGGKAALVAANLHERDERWRVQWEVSIVAAAHKQHLADRLNQLCAEMAQPIPPRSPRTCP